MPGGVAGAGTGRADTALLGPSRSTVVIMHCRFQTTELPIYTLLVCVVEVIEEGGVREVPSAVCIVCEEVLIFRVVDDGGSDPVGA